MKKLLLLSVLIFSGMNMIAQTDGISYQAVIINPTGEELPGVDSNGNILPNAKIAIRFTILNAANSEEYQEVQTTQTDLYGRINLIIGNQNRENFALVQWDGTPKDLKVEIDFKGSGSNFVDMSREQLTFVPYSYHRNILARGTLIVDDTTDLNGELIVQGPTNLNSTLNVNDNNNTNLSGELNVQGKTQFKNNFEVDGLTTLNDSLNVKAKSNFAGNMQVTADAVFEGKMDFKSEEPANFNSVVIKDSLDVDGISDLNGQVRIDASSSGNSKSSSSKNKSSNIASQDTFSDYPLTVEGSQQGIAIRVNGSRSEENNYVSFWDQTTNDNGTVSVDGGRMWGRIEGQSISNLENSEQYQQELRNKKWDVFAAYYNAFKAGWEIGIAGGELAARFGASTVCLGVGGCVTAPPPAPIAMQIITLVMKIADGVLTIRNSTLAIIEKDDFINYKNVGIGVTYSSGSGDYAEWLPKKNQNDSFVAGEIVGISNGMVTKNTWGVDNIMIVSTSPIVLGNMPAKNDEENNVKIAFMGQVPVKVLGPVQPGDYILPHELGSGFGKAVNPNEMTIKDYKKIAGVVWSKIQQMSDGISTVNVAVGLNTNDLDRVLIMQQEEIKTLNSIVNNLQNQLDHSNLTLSNLLPGYAEAIGVSDSISKLKKNTRIKENQDAKNHEESIVYANDDDIIYFEISIEQIEMGIVMARAKYQEMLKDSKLTKKLLSEKTENSSESTETNLLISLEEHPFWKKMDSDSSYRSEIASFIKSEIEKSFHTHKKYQHKFLNLKVRK